MALSLYVNLNMRTKTLFVATLVSMVAACFSACTPSVAKEEGPIGLKDVYEGKFLIGTALNQWQVEGTDTLCVQVVKEHFNAIVAENCMKNGPMHPTENEYNFKDADAFVKFGVDNGLTITGHCLIWHSQLAPWFCYDADHNLVPADTLKKRMKEHITTVVSRYKDQIIGWDVVNEAIEDDGSWRNSPLYQILGEEFIALAFQYAHEADPDAELYYNDYNMFMEGKRNTVVKMINDFKARGIKIDAVGMQAHIGMDYPEISEFEKSIQAFSDAGVKVMITELDLSALPTFKRTANVGDAMSFREMMEKGLPEHLNPYKDGIPDSASVAWNSRMMDFFNLFDKYSDAITRVTAWGVNDAQSWKNGFPIPGRTDYPLLFDRQYQPKPFVKELIENYKKNKK